LNGFEWSFDDQECVCKPPYEGENCPFPAEISIITFSLIVFLVEDGQCILPIPEERYDVETVLVIGGQEMIIKEFQ